MMEIQGGLAAAIRTSKLGGLYRAKMWTSEEDSTKLILVLIEGTIKLNLVMRKQTMVTYRVSKNNFKKQKSKCLLLFFLLRSFL
jgi:hypothetical protein